MDLLDATALLLVLAACFGFINYHLFRLPFTIGLLLGGLLGSFGVLALEELIPGWGFAQHLRTAVLSIDFADALLNGMLSVLLFAGALHTDLSQLRRRMRPIIVLATVGVVISTLVAGVATFYTFRFFGLNVAWVWCFAFGALISPTDPIAVLGIMKAAKAPKHLETKIIGESLFNDGTSVVAFTVCVGLGMALEQGPGAAPVLAPSGVLLLLAREILGGLGLGLATGWITYLALRTLDEPSLELLISFAAVFGLAYAASRLHVSAPLAAVTAGLFIGHRGRQAMSDRAARDLDVVWTFIDETLNAVLFLLIGLEVFAIDYSRTDYLKASICLVVAVLFARFVSVALPILAFRLRTTIGPGTIRVLTWGGLKGGVSVALAMKLPEFEGRNAVLTATYVVVVFSIVVQGLTVGKLIRILAPIVDSQRPPPPLAEPAAG
jgi:monovalent cation:H+ antiporter, CPA1 family